jgi:hypothetical protein
MSETPTKIVVNSADENAELDAAGIKIVVRVLNPVEQFRFKKVVGKFIDNPGYMLDAMMAASVRQIGGEPMPLPKNEEEIELILTKLGPSGWQEVQSHYQRLAKKAASEDVEVAKN